MDFDLGAYIGQLFQGLRGAVTTASTAFTHTDEEYNRDLPTMMRDGLRSRFAQAPSTGIQGVAGDIRPSLQTEDSRAALRSPAMLGGQRG